MYQTIQLSSCVSVQGDLVEALPNGEAVIREGGQLYRGRPIAPFVARPVREGRRRSPGALSAYSQPASSRSTIAVSMSTCGSPGVEAGDVGEGLAAGVQEGLADLAVDLLERLDAVGREDRRHDRDVALAGPREAGDLLDRVGLQPLLAAEARLEGDDHLVLREAEAVAEQAGRDLAVALVGVALGQVALGHAVVAGDERVGAAVEAGVGGLDRAGQRLDVERVVVVGRHGADRRLPAQGHQRAEGLVVGGGGGGGGILRVEREEEQALAAGLAEPGDHRGGRGVAVAHGEVDADAVAEAVGEAGRHRRGLVAGDDPERAVVGLGVPDPAVVGAGGERAPAEDDEMQQRLPLPGRVVDDAAIGQELAEVAAHRPVVGGVGGAEVGEDDADAGRRHRRVAGRGVGETVLAGRRGRGAASCLASLVRASRARRPSVRPAPRASARRGGGGAGAQRPRLVGGRRPAGQEDHLEGRADPAVGVGRSGRRRWRRRGRAGSAGIGRRRRSCWHVGLAHGAQVAHQRQRRGVADVVAAAVGDRQREAGALQQAAEVADLAHRRDARAEAAEGLDLGLGERGAQLGQGLAAEERGEEQAVGPERAAGLDELADRVVRPVQREGVDDEVVGAGSRRGSSASGTRRASREAERRRPRARRAGRRSRGRETSC